jgi:hypothetical protein
MMHSDGAARAHPKPTISPARTNRAVRVARAERAESPGGRIGEERRGRHTAEETDRETDRHATWNKNKNKENERRKWAPQTKPARHIGGTESRASVPHR